MLAWSETDKPQRKVRFAADATLRKTENTRTGKAVRHVPCKIITRGETWSTVELEDGTRTAAESHLVRPKPRTYDAGDGIRVTIPED